MVDAGSRPLCFYLRIRFNPMVMRMEDSVVSMLSFLLFRGDRVTWTKKRLVAYKLWERGATPREISEQMRIPLRVAIIWANIWDSYYVAFNTKEYNERRTDRPYS